MKESNLIELIKAQKEYIELLSTTSPVLVNNMKGRNLRDKIESLSKGIYYE